MGRSNPSVQKRLREQKLAEKREEKARRKVEREEAKQRRVDAIADGMDPAEYDAAIMADAGVDLNSPTDPLLDADSPKKA